MKNFWNKIPVWARWSGLGVLLLFAAGYLGVGWYLSSQLLTPSVQKVAYDQVVLGVDGASLSIQGGAYDIAGQVGLIGDSGAFLGILSAPTATNRQDKIATRTLLDASATVPKVGDHVSLQGNIWVSNPEAALGVAYQDITYSSPLGDMDAWLIPGTANTTWTIAVHGIGAPRSELLRFAEPILASGSMMMAINYRNDAGSPASPDGYTHLGDTEWQDLQAAVRYAKEHGAANIQLYGVSLGGSVVQNYLRRSEDVATTNITKVVLDSPALDWKQVIKNRIEQKGYPTFLSAPGFRVATMRSGIDFDRISTAPGSIRHPTLIIHNADDRTVPNQASKLVADAQPNLVKFVDFGKGGHTRAWNHDPARYEQLVTDFLKQ